MSKVVIVRGKGVLQGPGRINRPLLQKMFHKGLSLAASSSNPVEALGTLFRTKDKVGIKVNTIGGKKLSSSPELPLVVAQFLTEIPIPPKNIIIWDRTNRELKDAGHRLNFNRNGIRIFGTDTPGIGYSSSLVDHKNIGSLFSSIQTDWITSSISLGLLKDHGLAGITAGLKNYFGAIHNPNKYHDFNCNPFVAELFESPPVQSKHKLSILDGLVVQYHRGPSFHPKWTAEFESLIFSTDPVAGDTVGWHIIEKLRAKKGLPSLKEEQREPLYLRTAENLGLGQSDMKNIRVTEEEV